jgi:hypothetical protein
MILDEEEEELCCFSIPSLQLLLLLMYCQLIGPVNTIWVGNLTFPSP